MNSNAANRIKIPVPLEITAFLPPVDLAPEVISAHISGPFLSRQSFCRQTLFHFQQNIQAPLTAATNLKNFVAHCRKETQSNAKFKSFAEKFSAEKSDPVISREGKENSLPFISKVRGWEINFKEPVQFLDQ